MVVTVRPPGGGLEQGAGTNVALTANAAVDVGGALLPAVRVHLRLPEMILRMAGWAHEEFDRGQRVIAQANGVTGDDADEAPAGAQS